MKMNRTMVVLAVLSFLALNVGFAQRYEATLEQKRDLIERILAAKERPGRELDPAFRSIMLARLQRESMESLEKRLDSGNISTMALGDSSADLTYTTFQQPCRIIDTRLPGAGGALVNLSPRDFMVAGTTGFTAQGGTAAGCGVPKGTATAVMINFVAINPTAGGNLRGSAFPNAVPATGSIINYAALTPNLNIANGIVMPICDSTLNDCLAADMKIQANGGSTQLVADVLGYFTSFPKDEIRSFSVSTRASGGPTIGSSCTNFTSLVVTAPVAGKVLLRSNVTVQVPHTQATTDSSIVSLNLTNSACQDETSFGESQLIYVDAALPTGTHQPTTNALRLFSVGPGPTTFYLNGIKTAGSATQSFFAAGIEATFLPD